MRIRLVNIQPEEFRAEVQRSTGKPIDGTPDVGTLISNSTSALFRYNRYGELHQILEPVVTPTSFKAAFYLTDYGACIEFHYDGSALNMAIDGISNNRDNLDDLLWSLKRDLAGDNSEEDGSSLQDKLEALRDRDPQWTILWI